MWFGECRRSKRGTLSFGPTELQQANLSAPKKKNLILTAINCKLCDYASAVGTPTCNPKVNCQINKQKP